jgi:hypothetical protein
LTDAEHQNLEREQLRWLRFAQDATEKKRTVMSRLLAQGQRAVPRSMCSEPQVTASLFHEASQDIATAYTAFELDLGWRFLYTGRETLGRHAKLMLVGLNPAGSVLMENTPSSESGNLFRLAHASVASSRYREQVCRLFQVLAAGGLAEQWEALADKTPTLNYCPFRSRTWKQLESRSDVRQFNQQLWWLLFAELRPHVVICIGHRTLRLVSSTFADVRNSPPLADPQQTLVGWGQQKMLVQRHANGTVFVGLPHLSRFPIFGRPASEEAVATFTKEVLAGLDQDDPKC